MSPQFIYKASIRRKLRQKLKALSPFLRRGKSGAIARRLAGLPVFRNAQNVMIYVSLPGEVETTSLIRRALAMKKNVFAPRIKHNRIEAVQISDLNRDLTAGVYGILEPSAKKKVSNAVLDLIVIPGVGFDSDGGRLGRGIGYFDRFLEKNRKAKKIGLAFCEQFLEKIPMEPHDVPMDVVITD